MFSLETNVQLLNAVPHASDFPARTQSSTYAYTLALAISVAGGSLATLAASALYAEQAGARLCSVARKRAEKRPRDKVSQRGREIMAVYVYTQARMQQGRLRIGRLSIHSCG